MSGPLPAGVPYPHLRGYGSPVCSKRWSARAGGAADVEAPPGARPVSLAIPAHVALELVDRIEAAALNEALGQAERHRGVVGPAPGGGRTGRRRPCRSAARRCRAAELDGGADGVADGEAKERAAEAVSIERRLAHANASGNVGLICVSSGSRTRTVSTSSGTGPVRPQRQLARPGAAKVVGQLLPPRVGVNPPPAASSASVCPASSQSGWRSDGWSRSFWHHDFLPLPFCA